MSETNNEKSEAWTMGYADAYFDGMDLSSELPCKCDGCLKDYKGGQEKGMADLMKNADSS